MNTVVGIGEYQGLRVGSALISIVSGCIIIGVSKDCNADAVGGVFLGAGGLGLLISVFPFIRGCFNLHHILPIGNIRVHPSAPTPTPAPAPAPEPPSDSLRGEDTQLTGNVLTTLGTLAQLERSKSRMGTFAEAGTSVAEGSQDDGPSTDVPDILGRRKPNLSDVDLP